MDKDEVIEAELEQMWRAEERTKLWQELRVEPGPDKVANVILTGRMVQEGLAEDLERLRQQIKTREEVWKVKRDKLRQERDDAREGMGFWIDEANLRGNKLLGLLEELNKKDAEIYILKKNIEELERTIKKQALDLISAYGENQTLMEEMQKKGGTDQT